MHPTRAIHIALADRPADHLDAHPVDTAGVEGEDPFDFACPACGAEPQEDCRVGCTAMPG